MNKVPESPRRALGRGLSSLIPARTSALAAAAPATTDEAPTTLPIDAIDPNPMQPRSVFQADRLRELSDSIRANGVIQPLIVRRKGDRFELIAGERRWRAARMSGLTSVPVVVQELADEKLLEISLIENIQREDLNAIEVAHAYERLSKEHNLSHDEIGRRTGKDRATITNIIRLLKLPPDVQLLVAEHRLSMGHARALLGLSRQDLQQTLAEKAASRGLSVRQVERAVQKLNERREPGPQESVQQDPNVKAAIEQLERILGTRVRIVERSAERGRIEIEYFSQEDLDRIYHLITDRT